MVPRMPNAHIKVILDVGYVIYIEGTDVIAADVIGFLVCSAKATVFFQRRGRNVVMRATIMRKELSHRSDRVCGLASIWTRSTAAS